MNSQFRFDSYKIDFLKYDMKRLFDLLESAGEIDSNLWHSSISIREPFYSKSRKKFIGGFDFNLSLFPPGSNTANKEESLIGLDAGIAGVFSFAEGVDLKSETMENLVKVQIPAILYPYVRAAITSFFANAGFGSVILPLVNMNEVARQAVGKIEIKTVD